MKNKIILLIVLIFNSFFSYSQPTSVRKNISVREYCDGNLHLKKYEYKSNINYYYLTTESSELKRNIYSSSKNGSIRNLVFVLQKDSMRLNLQYQIKDDLELEIKNLNFIKGDYDINLHEYVKDKTENMSEIKLPFIIENFPDDCVNYKIEKNKL